MPVSKRVFAFPEVFNGLQHALAEPGWKFWAWDVIGIRYIVFVFCGFRTLRFAVAGAMDYEACQG